MPRLKSLIVETQAAEIAEAALVLPLMFLLLLGIFWLGRAFNVYSTITHAAQEGVRVATAPTCASCGAGGWNGTGYPTNATVVAAVQSALQASHLDTGAVLAPTSANPTLCAANANAPAGACSTTNNIRVCRFAQLTAGPPQVCGTTISFRYQLSMTLPASLYAPSGSGLQTYLENLKVATQVEMAAEQ